MGCDGFMPSSISTCFMNLLLLSVQPPMQLCKTNTPAASGKNKPNSTQNGVFFPYIYIYMASFQFSEGQDAWHVLISSYSREKGSSRSSRMISASTESWGTGETNSALKKTWATPEKAPPLMPGPSIKGIPKGFRQRLCPNLLFHVRGVLKQLSPR